MAPMQFTMKTVSDRASSGLGWGNLTRKIIGTFQEILTAKGDVQIKIPDNLSFEEASTLVWNLSNDSTFIRYQKLTLLI
jgi:NADPH:quinone reductase-like Zn-dependent oxidoreductase